MHWNEKLKPIWLGLDRRRLLDFADYLAVALAVSLPLSTSATGILVVIWLLVLLPALDLGELRGEICTWAGGLPLLLVVLATFGMLWADVAWSARAAGLTPFLKLLVIPWLFVQFRRSDRGLWILYGLLVGCVVLMLASFTEIILVRSVIPGKLPGIVVKDYISQSGFFVIAIFLLLEFAERSWRAGNYELVFAQTALIVVFLIDITYVATSRTTLIVIPVLLALFGARRNWKIAISACVIWAILFLVAWNSSSYMERRLESAFSVSADDHQLAAVSNRQRLAYWQASIDLIKQAPIIGHGTGTIQSMFRHYTAAGPDSDVNRVANPHNQTFIIALQFGLLGTIVLYGMWISHGKMFVQPGVAAWFGLTVLAQNFVSSLINSHLSDFTQGWTYVVCIGVAGGMVQRRNSLDASEANEASSNLGKAAALVKEES
jgi:O-antigen ligase